MFGALSTSVRAGVPVWRRGTRVRKLRVVLGLGRSSGLDDRLLASRMCQAAFAPRLTRLLARPLMSRAFRMGRFTALTGDLTLLVRVHRCESSVFFHGVLHMFVDGLGGFFGMSCGISGSSRWVGGLRGRS